MHERHEHEQYFFDEPTLSRLADVVAPFENPCCLCAPMLGAALAKRGVAVRILDLDERFASLPGFRRYDLRQPEWLGESFGLIVCDPPFLNVSLGHLFAALRVLSCNDYRQPLLLSYLRRREARLLKTFARFRLAPTGFCPTYRTVEPAEKNEIAWYGNVDEGLLAKL
jgi:hypothetical protein